MILTKEWQLYDKDYQKKMQDIQTHAGDVYLCCWPNAGVWHTGDGKNQIPDKDVKYVRLTHNKGWQDDED